MDAITGATEGGLRMTYKQAKIILAYAAHDMDATAASRSLYMADCTVGYHLKNVAAETGRDPRKFYDLCYLVGIAAQVMEGRKYIGMR